MFEGRPPREGAWPSRTTRPSRPSSATSCPTFERETPRNSPSSVIGSGPRSRSSVRTPFGFTKPGLSLLSAETSGRDYTARPAYCESSEAFDFLRRKCLDLKRKSWHSRPIHADVGFASARLHREAAPRAEPCRRRSSFEGGPPHAQREARSLPRHCAHGRRRVARRGHRVGGSG